MVSRRATHTNLYRLVVVIVSITTIVYVVATVAELVVVLEAVLVDLSVIAVAVGLRKRGMGKRGKMTPFEHELKRTRRGPTGNILSYSVLPHPLLNPITRMPPHTRARTR